jgi:hypothetical protein
VTNEARYYFGLSADPSLEEIGRITKHYPVFRMVEDGHPPLLTAVGISPHYVITLEVPGRRSGVIRRTTMVRVARDGGRYLVAGSSRPPRAGRRSTTRGCPWPASPSGSATCGPPTGKSCSATGTGTGRPHSDLAFAVSRASPVISTPLAFA